MRITNVSKECYCYAEALVVPFSLKKKTNKQTKKPVSSQIGQQKKNVFEINFGGKYDFKWFELILVANMSFNGLTRGLKTVCNKPKPSLEVTQKLKR